MVHPLVAHAQGMFAVEGRRDAVLSQHRQPIRHTVVNFRVNVIRPSRQHDALLVVLLHPLQCLQAFGAHIGFGALLLVPARVNRVTNFLLRDIEGLAEKAHKRVRRRLFAGQREERFKHPHAPFGHVLDVVGDVLRIRHNHRTVKVVLGLHILLPLVEHARIEDCPDALINQPLHMPVRHLRRIALASARGECPVRRAWLVRRSAADSRTCA